MYKEVLRLDSIAISYGSRIIIKDLSLIVHKGEFVSIIGPNGSGKSTIIKGISDSISLSAGKIFLLQKDNIQYSTMERARIIAVVPQDFSTEFSFTNYDIVMMGRNPYQSKIQKQTGNDYSIVKNAMKKTNTWHLRERYFNQLSGGERQRVVIARAIAQQPDIILLDEPTSHLDIHHQLEVLELIKNLNKESGLTVLAVLHDINMAARFSQRIILLKEGKSVADGSPKEVIKEENLSKLYKMQMLVRNNRLLSIPEVIPLRISKDSVATKDKTIHIICGGGSGENIIEKLYSMENKITCGVINKGDSDWDICKALNVDMIEEQPFSDISEENFIKNIKLMENADIILVTDTPFGYGNIKNLEALKKVSCPIYVKDSKNRDFTDGEVEEIFKDLIKENRLQFINNYQEFIEGVLV